MSEMIERIARALIRSHGGIMTTSDEYWPGEVARYYEMCAKFPDYANGGSLVTDAFRNARTAIEEMRRPEEMMAAAACGTLCSSIEGRADDIDICTAVWMDMCDAALTYTQEGGDG